MEKRETWQTMAFDDRRLRAADRRRFAVDAITTAHIVKILEPIWNSKTETASRLRGRIESVLDWAKARHYRDGENCARWKGHLDMLLPAPTKLKTIQHHVAMPYDALPDFMRRLQAIEGIAARALEFTILTAGRSGEVLGATWPEIDTGGAVWTIAANRMKVRPRTSGAVVGPRCGRLGGIAARSRKCLRFQRRQGRPAARQYGPPLNDEDVGRRNGPRIQIEFRRLGERAIDLPARNRRIGIGPYDRRRDRTCLSSRRCD
jgi:integrase